MHTWKLLLLSSILAPVCLLGSSLEKKVYLSYEIPSIVKYDSNNSDIAKSKKINSNFVEFPSIIKGSLSSNTPWALKIMLKGNVPKKSYFKYRLNKQSSWQRMEPGISIPLEKGQRAVQDKAINVDLIFNGNASKNPDPIIILLTIGMQSPPQFLKEAQEK
jgi:hypothetical protein